MMLHAPTLIRAAQIPGWHYDSELRWLAFQAEQHHRIIEVGCWKGKATVILAGHTEGTVWAVDHWQGPSNVAEYAWDYQELETIGTEGVYKHFREYLAPELKSGKVIVVKRDSLDGAQFLRNAYGAQRFDMVYLDADHTYEAMKADIEAYQPLLQPGGLLCGHDHNYPGVEQAVKALLPQAQLAGNIWYVEV